ncbi:MAG TPA: efflux RND transporter periplasmic adaptor subunit [Thermoanaerobaculia bacterium]|jgi:membrane fusion protein (multidrug efflux system)|nr:efflux RND transporter periplasmic adaptor subunit [Thermoanaerobaculia bacterium]
MKKRMFVTVLAIVAFVAVIGAVKYRQISKGMAQQAAFHMPPESVTTVVAKSEEWASSIAAIGSVTAVQGVVVSADLPGVVEKIYFESGKMVRAGETLVQLDVRQEQAQLASAEAGLKLSQVNLDRMQNLNQQGIAAKADWDKLDAETKQADAKIAEIKATIARKTIKAPFSGLLGIRQVNLGQYLAAGAPIVPLQSLDPIYVNFNVPQQQVSQLKAGDEVRVSSEGNGPFKGKITAVNSVIDEATRNIQIQATLSNPQGRLRPGMYVNTTTGVGTAAKVIPLPASSINFAPYGDSVYVVEEMKDQKSGKPYKGVRQQFVKLGPGKGDQVAVLSGIKPGEEIVTSGVFKLRPNAAVQVNNKTVPSNNPAPKPEDS